jgi:hypothetical protein
MLLLVVPLLRLGLLMLIRRLLFIATGILDVAAAGVDAAAYTAVVVDASFLAVFFLCC